MLKSLSIVLIAAFFISGFTGCEAKKTAAQIRAEKERVWKIDKTQRAAKFYKILIQKYPDTEYAAKAKQNLAALGPVPATPKPVAH